MSMSNTDPGTRSAADIERDVERTRANLAGTLDELRERASPGQLFEQAMDYVRSSGGNDMVRNLGQQVRDNPLPLLLIGAGIGWLMMSGNRGSGGTATGTTMPMSPQRSMEGSGRVVGSGQTRVRVYGSESGSMASQAAQAAGGLRDSVAGAADQAIDKVGQAYRGTADAASSAVDSLQGAAASAMDRVAGTGQALYAQAGDMTGQAREGVTWLMREQPLVLGAIGIALGAAVGAMLPGTETEDRLMGETRDALAGRAQALAEEGYERVKETAGGQLERAQGAVGQAGEGGGVSRLGEAVTDAAREARGAVRQAAQDLAGEARQAMDQTPAR